MTIDDKIRDEKLPYDINREAAKESALSSGTIVKYEYLTGKENLLLIKKALFTDSPLGKAFEKQIKIIKDQGEKNIYRPLLEEHVKQLVNKRVKKDFNSNRVGVTLQEQKRYLRNLLNKFYDFQNLKNKINPNNLIYMYKSEG